MEAGTKVNAETKEGKKVKGTFVSTAKGWTIVSIKGVETKFRASKVTEVGAKVVKLPVKKKAKPVDGEDTRLVKPDLEKYTLHESKTANGRRHLDINDDTAAKLREMELPAIFKYAAEVCEVTQAELHRKYDNLNPGMQRMNLGNRIRAIFKAAQGVKEGKVGRRKAAA